MKSQNAEFFDKYKSLDKLCSEIYGGSNGVTQYIDDMNSVPYSQSRKVSGWDNTIKELKKYRHFRNELAHGDLDIGGDNCSDEDINWISDFRDSILNRNDPIARLRKIEENDTNKNSTSGAKSTFEVSSSNGNNTSTQKTEHQNDRLTNGVFVILILLLILVVAGFILLLRLILSY